jgi:hypothetical protein
MTSACVSEYVNVKLVQTPGGSFAQCPEGPPLAVQYVDYTAGAAATTNAFNPKAKFLRIQVDSICARRLGSAPVAVAATDERMSAEQTEYLGLPPDHGVASDTTKVAYKISFITRT